MNAEFRVDGHRVSVSENHANDLKYNDGRNVEYREIDPWTRDPETGECLPVEGPDGEWSRW